MVTSVLLSSWTCSAFKKVLRGIFCIEERIEIRLWVTKFVCSGVKVTKCKLQRQAEPLGLWNVNTLATSKSRRVKDFWLPRIWKHLKKERNEARRWNECKINPTALHCRPKKKIQLSKTELQCFQSSNFWWSYLFFTFLPSQYRRKVFSQGHKMVNFVAALSLTEHVVATEEKQIERKKYISFWQLLSADLTMNVSIHLSLCRGVV